MEDIPPAPEWFLELVQSMPEHDETNHGRVPRVSVKCGTVDEFCGKFGLTREKALYEINHWRLWRIPVHFIGKGAEYSFTLQKNTRIDNCILSPFGSVASLPYQEFDRYAAIIAAKKLTAEPSNEQHPCLDPAHPFYAEELALALRAWEHVVASKPIKANWAARIERFLTDRAVSGKQIERIKTATNPFPKPGPKKRK